MGPGADRARLDFGLVVGHLVIAEGHVEQHLMGRRIGQRVGRHPPRVTVRLAAVPQQLDDVEDQRSRFFVGIGRVQEFCELVEVDRTRQQHRVVHRGHAQRGAREVGRDGGQRAAHDAALAVAVVVGVAYVQHRRRGHRAVLVEGGVGGEAAGVDHRAREVQLVEQPLLQAVSHSVEQ